MPALPWLLGAFGLGGAIGLSAGSAIGNIAKLAAVGGALYLLNKKVK
jgi:hypothetical protein